MKVLKFGAVWCPGCLVMKPLWKEIEAELPWLETEYFDADEAVDIVKQYNVQDLPTFIFLDKEGNEIHREWGEIAKKILLKIIEEHKHK